MTRQLVLTAPHGRVKSEECIILLPEDEPSVKPRAFRASRVAGPEGEGVPSSDQGGVGTPLRSHAHDEKISLDTCDDMVYFVGNNGQEFVGRKSLLSAISPVFQAMFSGNWKEADGRLTISPDINPESFIFLLRYAAGEDKQELDDESVWTVLQVADMYQVEALIEACFRFLLKGHGRCDEARHLCVVLELTHRLHRPTWRSRCLRLISTRKAAKVLGSKSCLKELCRECMLALVQAEDMHVVDEVLVLKAVWTWALQACRKNRQFKVRRSELRASAGDLVYHVRYLCIPRRQLTSLLRFEAGPCLLTAAERRNLLLNDGSLFPATVRVARNSTDDSDDSAQERGARTLDLPHREVQKCGPRGYLCTALLALLFVALLFTFGFPIIPAAVVAFMYGAHNGTDLFKQKYGM